MAMSDPQISLVRAGASVVRTVLFVRRPMNPPIGGRTPDHSALATALSRLDEAGGVALQEVDGLLGAYLDAMAVVSPSELGRDDALAYWINVYNAGALRLAARSERADLDSVLRQPGAFTASFITIEGEDLSLDGVEHGKVRRFADPRIHAALVCGSTSCPTLRAEPFVGDRLDAQLEDQMRFFLAAGGATWDGKSLVLSKVFSWYSGDFVRPHRMPVLLPASGKAVARSLAPWLPADLQRHVNADTTPVTFAPYDWGLRCALA